ncbi:hypothetical protein QL285_084671 [Trifolium repens]|nr:hypothetical protein QL285_084671 [Trifolium repens]
MDFISTPPTLHLNPSLGSLHLCFPTNIHLCLSLSKWRIEKKQMERTQTLLIHLYCYSYSANSKLFFTSKVAMQMPKWFFTSNPPPNHSSSSL